jgi:hypothetical protein
MTKSLNFELRTVSDFTNPKDQCAETVVISKSVG